MFLQNMLSSTETFWCLDGSEIFCLQLFLCYCFDSNSKKWRSDKNCKPLPKNDFFSPINLKLRDRKFKVLAAWIVFFLILRDKSDQESKLFMNFLTNVCDMYQYKKTYQNYLQSNNQFFEDRIDIYKAILSLCINCRFYFLRYIGYVLSLIEV